ncbi:hypothetical protein EDC04DRAFT_2609424 [Pisolithus marmoratus]|nr:hypothetical protein EDC04DRAFT_2609424 [Pisolithus marmoratus]
MDYLPKLADNGHNWTAYGSWVLCAIIDEGLMGFLVGSETRPVHPAGLDGRDTIFGLMLHLKSPHEKWDYLEKRFGSIPRPESWLAAEAMRQWETQPEQSAAGETIQSTCDSHDEPENLTGSQENTSDSPNDRTEIPTGYLEPETEIVDVRQTEGSSLVDEAGATGHGKPGLTRVELEGS